MFKSTISYRQYLNGDQLKCLEDHWIEVRRNRELYEANKVKDANQKNRFNYELYAKIAKITGLPYWKIKNWYYHHKTRPMQRPATPKADSQVTKKPTNDRLTILEEYFQKLLPVLMHKSELRPRRGAKDPYIVSQAYDELMEKTGWRRRAIQNWICQRRKRELEKSNPLTNAENASQNLHFNYVPSYDHLTDVCLNVNNRLFAISKKALFDISPYFQSLYQLHRNQKSSYVSVSGVAEKEFEEFLFVTIQNAPITMSNLLLMLKLADHFDVTILTRKCEDYMTSCAKNAISLLEVLRLCNLYGLEKVLDHYIAKMKLQDFERITKEYDTKMFDDHIKSKLYGRLIDLL